MKVSVARRLVRAKCLIELGTIISNAGERLDAFGRKLFAAGAKKLVVQIRKENPYNPAESEDKRYLRGCEIAWLQRYDFD